MLRSGERETMMAWTIDGQFRAVKVLEKEIEREKNSDSLGGIKTIIGK